MYRPRHGMSERALEADWNVFVWAEDNICMGWHIDDELSMTFSSLYRWITLLYEAQIPGNFYLQAVDIKSPVLALYTPVPTGDPIPRDSKGQVSPGDYCLYNLDGSQMRRLVWAKYNSCSFADLNRIGKRLVEKNKDLPDILSMTKLPPHIEDEVVKRDTSCALTGAENNLIVNWVYPPWADYMLVPHEMTFPGAGYVPVPEKDLDPWLVVTNYFRLAEDVADLFRENVLCIDVDDNYRIVFLTGHGCLTRPLQTHYVPPPGPNRPSDDFLREHFKHSLYVHSGGGDMLDDYSTVQIDAIIEKLGVGVDGDDLNIDLSHRLWKSAIGKEIFRFLVTLGLVPAQ